MTKEADAKEKKAKGGKKDDDTSPKGNKREDRAQARMLEQVGTTVVCSRQTVILPTRSDHRL
jgi:hypothetical protein